MDTKIENDEVLDCFDPGFKLDKFIFWNPMAVSKFCYYYDQFSLNGEAKIMLIFLMKITQCFYRLLESVFDQKS